MGQNHDIRQANRETIRRIVIAWMGGSAPQPLEQICPDERGLVSILFAEQVLEHAGYWGNISLDTCRIFWNRARHDAHATYRNTLAAKRHANHTVNL